MVPKVRYATQEAGKLKAEFTLLGLEAYSCRDGVVVELRQIPDRPEWYEIPEGYGKPLHYLMEAAEQYLENDKAAVICGLDGSMLSAFRPHARMRHEGEVQATFVLTIGCVEVVASKTGHVELYQWLLKVPCPMKVHTKKELLSQGQWDRLPEGLRRYRNAVTYATLKATTPHSSLPKYVSSLR